MKTARTLRSWLVVAAALTLGMASCSVKDNALEEPQQTPEVGKIHIELRAGIGNEPTTRSTVDYTNGKRTLLFSEGDRIYVNGKIDDNTYVAGTLTMQEGSITDGGKSATFEGEVKAYDNSGNATAFPEGITDPLAACSGTDFPATGTLLSKDIKEQAYGFEDNKSIKFYPEYMVAADVNTLMTTALYVSGLYDSESKSFTLSTKSPIFNCALSGLTPSTTYTFRLKRYKESDETFFGNVKYETDESGDASFAFATNLPTAEEADWRLIVFDENATTEICSVDLGSQNITTKVYNISRHFVNLATLKANNLTESTFTAQNGDILYGTLDGTKEKVKISVADGAKVTLSGVDIIGVNAEISCPWAGINCPGDATIILARGTTNTVKGFSCYWPGIYIAPGKTLTVQGSGSLTASGVYGVEPPSNPPKHNYGAGIGGGQSISCGNIVINGGDISAIGDYYAAGIGGGQDASCGNITISGGTIKATGANCAAAIGCGFNYRDYGEDDTYCGDITISGGSVEAKGGYQAAGIGGGYDAYCGKITISGGYVKASGGTDGAGIGSAYTSPSNCGDIIISGGTVEATGGYQSAGIGSGHNASCGNITILSTVISVIATKGGSFSTDPASIGAGTDGTCGTVIIQDHSKVTQQ